MAEPPSEPVTASHLASPGANRSRLRPAVVVPAFVVLALVGGQLPPFSLPATLYVVALGGTLILLRRSCTNGAGFGQHRPDLSGTTTARSRGWGAVWWVVPVVVAGSMEATNYVLGSTHQHPTISILLDPLFAGEPARTALYLGWLAGFWALVRR